IGFDAAFNYKTRDLNEALAETCPDGIDVNFENVGGKMLEAVLNRMNHGGRIIFCGSISGYNETTPQPGPNNLMNIVRQEITMRGFIVMSYGHLMGDFYRDMRQWLKDGSVKYRETIIEGIEKAPEAFMGMLRGENFGKMIVQVSDDPTR
ncbi:MAG: NADP-dependent oxidoreductase, partial [Rhodospirillales bacterium]|nr:NADP-dependent oxidoreductase [Rhodospirillales bacterium]